MADQKGVAQANTVALVRRLWREWMRPHAPTLALLLVVIAVIGGATGLYPVLIKLAFEAFSAKDARAIVIGPILVIAVTTVKGFALLGLTVFTNRIVTQIEAKMQTALYGHLIDADLAQLGRESPAALTQRFTTDFVFIREALARLSTVFLRELATLTALIAAMLWIDPILTLVAAVAVPFGVYPITRLGRKLRRVANSTQEQIGVMASLVSESLGGARVAKTYGLEDYLKGRAAKAFDDVRRLKMKAANARGRLDPLLEMSAGFAVAGVLILIGWRILDGSSTIGDFTGFVTALMLAAHPVRSLGNLNAVIQEAVAALNRYYATLDEARAIVDRPDAVPLKVSEGEIRFAGVRFHYRSDVPTLEGIDLVAPGGKTTALVGRSGSGKSTLLSLVPRLYDVTGGAVMIDGQDVRSVSLRTLRDNISVVSQDVVLFDDTVRANIAFGRQGAGEEDIVAAAKAAAAHDFIQRLPEGYDTRVGVGGARLSGGERQRVSLARAFLKNAPILLLDEATSSLDAESEQLVQEALATLMQGRTTLVIAHRLSTIRAADLIIVMEAGRVAETGTHDSLMSRGGTYARLQRLQVVDIGPDRPGVTRGAGYAS